MKVTTDIDPDEAHGLALEFAKDQDKKPWCQHGAGHRFGQFPCMGNGWLMESALVDSVEVTQGGLELFRELFPGRPAPKGYKAHVRPQNVSKCPCQGQTEPRRDWA